MSNRRLPSFVKAFETYLEPMGAPKLFGRWAALWTMSAALERRVWVHTKRMDLFPNMFIILASPPGIGKGTAIGPIRDLIDSLGDHRLSASSMTHASFADDLRGASRAIVDTKSQKTIEYNCLNVLSNEFQVLFPQYDTFLLGKLTDTYDGKQYSESRRGGEGKNTFHLPRVLVNLLAGTTPEHLFSTFPESAWGTGFMSRTILVWSTDMQIRSLFESPIADNFGADQQFEALRRDIKLIASMYGAFTFEASARDKIDAFHQSGPFGGPPLPSHPRLINYASRRTAHLLKLMMLSAVDRGAPDYVLHEADYTRAYNWLIDVETAMTEIFKIENTGGDSQIMNDLHHFVSAIYIKTGKPVPAFKLSNFILGRTVAMKIDPILSAGVSGGWFKRATVEKVGTCYVPLARTPSEDEV